MVASLALQTEHRFPVVAAMLLEEIERAELHEADTLPETAVTIGSQVDFVDEKTSQLRIAELVEFKEALGDQVASAPLVAAPRCVFGERAKLGRNCNGPANSHIPPCVLESAVFLSAAWRGRPLPFTSQHIEIPHT